MEYIFIYPESHEHLGLFDDLKGMDHVNCVVTEKKTYRGRLPRLLEKVYLSGTVNRFFNLPGKYRFYEDSVLRAIPEKGLDPSEKYCVAVLDGALRGLSVKRLNALFSKKNVRGVLLLINSLGADSTVMHEIRPLIPRIHWDDIYTFDPVEQRKYSWKSIRNAYYSFSGFPEQKAGAEQKDQAREEKSRSAGKAPGRPGNGADGTDVYFAGGIKGGREQLVLDIFHTLRKGDAKVLFELMTAGTRRFQNNKNRKEAGLVWFSGGWKPYADILEHVRNTNVILEVLQKGQHGPSLRYYEAVCCNKKLLTNNRGIRKLPFYNPKYMRVISSAKDIDPDWIKKKEPVDYRYAGEFSPVHLLEIIVR